jgi:hypothetical protein
MKKLLFLFIAVTLSTTILHAQTLPADVTGATTAGFNVKSLTKGIMEKLIPSLSLTDAQKPGVTSTITDFLTKKSKILPLQQTDASSYSSKFGPLFDGLKKQLGGILSPTQLTSFLNLKPATNDSKNVLSNLFY